MSPVSYHLSNEVPQLVLVVYKFFIILTDVEGEKLTEEKEMGLEFTLNRLPHLKNDSFPDRLLLLYPVHDLHDFEPVIPSPKQAAQSDVNKQISHLLDYIDLPSLCPHPLVPNHINRDLFHHVEHHSQLVLVQSSTEGFPLLLPLEVGLRE